MAIVVGAWIFHNRKLLLALHKKWGYWMPPGGHVEDETMEEAILREMREELGRKVELVSPISGPIVPFRIARGETSYGGPNIVVDFLARLPSKDIQPDSEEIEEYAWFSQEELADERLGAVVRSVALQAFSLMNLRVVD